MSVVVFCVVVVCCCCCGVTLARYAMAFLATPTVCAAALELAAFPLAVTRTLVPGLLRTLVVLRRF